MSASRAAVVGVATVAATIAFARRDALAPRMLAALSGAVYIDRGDVIRQRSHDDCGVAALEMVLRTHHLPTSNLDSLRGLTERRSRGLSFAELGRAAVAHGLEASGWTMSEQDLAAARLPAVVHFRNHYLLLDSVRAGGLFLRDPSIGRVKMTSRAFRRRWTGRVLIFSENGEKRE